WLSEVGKSGGTDGLSVHDTSEQAARVYRTGDQTLAKSNGRTQSSGDGRRCGSEQYSTGTKDRAARLKASPRAALAMDPASALLPGIWLRRLRIVVRE